MVEIEREEGSALSGDSASNENWGDRRISVRFRFRGSSFPIYVDGLDSTVRLRDVSCGGASCLSEAPLEVGDTVLLELDRKHVAAARVCWVRRVLVGLRFVNPLDPVLVRRIHAARSDDTRHPR